jgi:hypothetical protein
MPHRFILYDALSSLSRGNVLVRLGDFSFSHHLDGVPEVCVVFGHLLANEWIRPEEGYRRDGVLGYFSITDEGLRTLDMGRLWYRSIPLWRRVVGRAWGVRLARETENARRGAERGG